MKVKFTSAMILAGVLFTAVSLSAQQAPAVNVDTVTEAMETGTKKYIGKLTAIQDVALPARVSGKLLNCYFKEGGFVKKGDLLMQLEDTTYIAAQKAAQAQLMQAEAQMKQAEAQMKQAEATLIYAEKNFKREKSLTDVNAQKEFDAAQRDYNTATANKAAAAASMAAATASKAAAEAALLDANNNLSYTKIYADFPGKIGKATYSVGNYVTPSSGSLAQLVQFDPIYVRFAISEPDFMSAFGDTNNLKKDGVVRIRMANRELYPLTAKITIVDNKIDDRTGTITLWATMDNKDLVLTPGAIVDVLLSRASAVKKPAVPVSAIQTAKDGQFVWVLDEKTNIVSKQPVVAGEIIGSRQIVSGVTPGQVVVTDGMHKIIQMPGVPAAVSPVRKTAE